MTQFCKKRRLLFIAVTCIFSNLVFAQQNLTCQGVPSDVDNTSIEELMELPAFLSVSQQAACKNEAANIVTYIGQEQILTSGARDLVDVLQLVPGFFFGNDMANTVSAGVRGVSTNDGKMSVFIDGIMLTEREFGSNVFGGHYPIEQIDHIEIIRGSSSIMNGNFAQMGVINIISKNAKQIDGLAITTDYGRFERGEARKNINMVAGKVFDDLEVSFSGKANESQRSDRIYTDAHKSSFDMANNSQLDSLYGNLGLTYKELKLRLISDDYNIEARDGFSDVMMPKKRYITNEFSTQAAKLEFEHPFNANFKLNADANFSRQSPWERSRHYEDGTPTKLLEKVVIDNYKVNTKATWMDDSGSYLAVGNSYQTDNYSFIVSPAKPLTFDNYTAYTEGVYKTPFGDLLAGLRFDSYNKFGTNLAPRVALTKQFDQFHYKLLYTHAFHTPTAGNYQLNVGYNEINTLDRHLNTLAPELTQTYEVELGYRFSRHLDWTSNIFLTHLKDLLTYSIDVNDDDFYINGPESDVYGGESSIKYQHDVLGKFDINYSIYQAHQHEPSKHYQAFINGQLISPKMNLGFPTHKATFNHTFNFTPDLSFNHSVIFFSDRLGYSGENVVHYKPEFIYNTFLRYQNMPVKGAEVGLGLYDVFNARWQYVQQYNGGHPALPAEARELMLRLSYKF
jgi:outer membrane receptor for ferrienterochelin and colicin